MSPRHRSCRVLASVALLVSAVVMAGCAGRSNEALDEARASVERAQTDPDILAHARDELAEAERSLSRALNAARGGASQDELDHLAYLTKQRVAIADARADERAALAEIDELGREREQLTVDSRDREIRSLQSQLAELQAQQTDRGLVVTLGDILFDLDRAELNPGGELQVARLADALRQMPDRNVLIEGHTDSSGSDAYNDELSSRRAEAVESQLILQGVDPTRVVTRGYGERYPVATNDTAAGRQQNRRVEIVILNPGEVDAPRATLQ
jgi:outer membrane protein OmpA-like peptidoglycan-associated protein